MNTPAHFKIDIPHEAYDRNRYMDPWGALVTLNDRGNPSYDKSAGRYAGDDKGGTVHFTVPAGVVIATGQQDFRSVGATNNWYLVRENGDVESVDRKAGIEYLKSRTRIPVVELGTTSGQSEDSVVTLDNDLVDWGGMSRDEAEKTLDELSREEILSLFADPLSVRRDTRAVLQGKLLDAHYKSEERATTSPPIPRPVVRIAEDTDLVRKIFSEADMNEVERFGEEKNAMHFSWNSPENEIGETGRVTAQKMSDSLPWQVHGRIRVIPSAKNNFLETRPTFFNTDLPQLLTPEEAVEEAKRLIAEVQIAMAERASKAGTRVKESPEFVRKLFSDIGMTKSLTNEDEAMHFGWNFQDARNPIITARVYAVKLASGWFVHGNGYDGDGGKYLYGDASTSYDTAEKAAAQAQLLIIAVQNAMAEISTAMSAGLAPEPLTGAYPHPEDEDCGSVDNININALSRYFSQLLQNGRVFSNIVDARKVASQKLGGKVEAGTSAAKTVEECIELGAVLCARRIIEDMRERKHHIVIGETEFNVDEVENLLAHMPRQKLYEFIPLHEWPSLSKATDTEVAARVLKNWFGEEPRKISSRDAQRFTASPAFNAIVSDKEANPAPPQDIAIYRALADLNQRMPNLGTRTSSSITMQAYSTPLPIAFLASRIAGINEKTTVYEPSAGNGALLIEARHDMAMANELDTERAARLISQGFMRVGTTDAAKNAPTNEKYDRIVANPPFGGQSDEDNNKITWYTGSYDTPRLDHAILFKSLEALKEDGRAVLLMGGAKGNDEARRKQYRVPSQTQFYRQLYDNFIVEDHFTLDGKLYGRQGANWPVDILVINGRGKTENRNFPGASPPRIYTTFEELEEVLHEYVVDTAERIGRNVAGSAATPARDDSGQRGTPVPGSNENRQPSAPERPGRRSGHDGGSGNAGEQIRTAVPANDSDGLSDSRTSPGTSPGHVRRGTVAPDVSAEGAGDGRRSGPAGNIFGVGGQSSPVIPADSVGVGEQTPDTNRTLKAASDIRETVFQVPYKQASVSYPMGTLVPKNMATALNSSLRRLQEKYGDVDEYVAKELGYDKQVMLDAEYFSAEQIDAIALAIDNLKNGSGFIIGDQTGIGKGRVNAAIIRWSIQRGKTPVFCTVNPELYAAMVEDLADIGMPGFNPLPTNNSLDTEKIQFHDGRMLSSKRPEKHTALLREQAENGVADFDAVFTTYKQLGTIGNKPSPRRELLQRIAGNAIFILDESHNAGGESKTNKMDVENTSMFIKRLLETTPNGAFYSSATYAKRPDNMAVYFTTDIHLAVDDVSALADTISRGGIPMQQAVAAMLTQSGQYIRRERSFEGAELSTKMVEINPENAEKSASIMRAIMEFDALKAEAVEQMDEQAANAGGRVDNNKSTGKSGAVSSNFTSVMHNFIAQSLLTQKADAVINDTVELVEKGEKVVISLANTMGSIIDLYAKENALRPGDQIDLTYSDLFIRYLNKSREIIFKDVTGKTVEKRLMTDAELGPNALRAFKKAENLISECDFSALPASPIDYMLNALRKRGISVDEITGRTARIDYSSGIPVYAIRKNGSGVKNAAKEKFNSGEVDVLIVNQSGATGISLHSSEKFKDQRRRTMIIAQPELDINIFQQMLGRIFRTGQVVPPAYRLLFSNLPAEKRVAAVLAKKLGSLNANTTAGKDSDTSFKNIPDFLNDIGDAVAKQIIGDDPELEAQLGYPLPPEGTGCAGAMRRVTGRIPVLPIKKQEELYSLLETEYKELVAQKEALGGTGLEAKALPLDARLVSSSVMTPAKDVGKKTPFADASHLNVYDVKRLGKPYPAEKVRELVKEGTETSVRYGQVRSEIQAWIHEHQESVEEDGVKKAALASLHEKAFKSEKIVRTFIQEFPPGRSVMLMGDNMYMPGIVTNVKRNEKIKNPTALSAWKVNIAVVDAAKMLTLSLAQVHKKPEEGGIDLKPVFLPYRADPYEAFDRGQSQSRMKVCIATGNILTAYEKIGKGKIVTFSDCEGNVLPGVMLPQDVKPEEVLENIDITMNPEQAFDFVSQVEHSQIKTGDKALTLTKQDDGTYSIVVNGAKKTGGKYFLNRELLKVVPGKEFIKSGCMMCMDNLTDNQVLTILNTLKNQGVGFIADNNRKDARQYAGMTTDTSQTATKEFTDAVKDFFESEAKIEVTGELPQGLKTVVDAFERQKNIDSRFRNRPEVAIEAMIESMYDDVTEPFESIVEEEAAISPGF
jgi:hypothetical protein